MNTNLTARTSTTNPNGFTIPKLKGTAVAHVGRRLHGVLPIESGNRVSLILMYLDNL